jgi:hypothetical protein
MRLHTENEKIYLFLTAIFTGILIWDRPELSIAIVPVIICYLLIRYRKYYIEPFIIFFMTLGISLVPMFLNNIAITNSPLKFPYQLTNLTMGGYHLETTHTVIDLITNELPLYIIHNIMSIDMNNIVGLILFPLNGGLGILTILMISIIVFMILPFKISNIKIGIYEKLSITFSLSVICMYIFTTFMGSTMHMESGMLPDMRYFSIIYVPVSIASISLLSKYFKLDYISMIKNYILYLLVLIVFVILALCILFKGNITTADIDSIFNIMSIVTFAVGLSIFLNAIRTKSTGGLTTIIPIIIAIPMCWQIIITICTPKLYQFPFILPIVDAIISAIFV